MYGKNPVAKPRDANFVVKEIFPTIQGEGPYAGRPSLFVRLAHCNLRCYFCDTDFDGGTIYEAAQLGKVIHLLALEHKLRLIVFTGGEPLLQPLHLLLPYLSYQSLIQIETAGTVWPEGMKLRDTQQISFVVSPKTPLVHKNIAAIATAWKYIIRAGEVSEDDGLPRFSTQRRGKEQILYRPRALQDCKPSIIYVQPCDEGSDTANAENMKEAIKSSMTFGYTLSLQLHKIAGLP